LFLGCEGVQPRIERPPATDRAAAETDDARDPIVSQPRTAADVLQLLNTGSEEAALAAFLALTEQAEPSRLRVFRLSETEYTRVPQTDRDALAQQYLDAAQSMHRLSLAARDRGRVAMDQNDHQTASRWFQAIRALGLANAGPPESIVLIGDMMGRALVEMADSELTNLSSQVPELRAPAAAETPRD
jgi:hypothetical protein